MGPAIRGQLIRASRAGAFARQANCPGLRDLDWSNAVEDESRLETIEIKIAHMESAIQQLSDVVYRQQKQMDGVLAANRQLVQQVAALEARTSNEGGNDEVPPHY